MTKWVLVLAFLVSSIASATVMRDLSLQELVRYSDLVVRGKAHSGTSYWVEGKIYTRTTFDVEEIWVNRIAHLPKTVDVVSEGGVVDGIGQRSDGMVYSKANERVVLCLKRKPDGTYGVVGMALGAFFVADPIPNPKSQIVRRLANVNFINKAEITIPPTLGDLRSAILEAARAR
jgi:hypothetical protein